MIGKLTAGVVGGFVVAMYSFFAALLLLVSALGGNVNGDELGGGCRSFLVGCFVLPWVLSLAVSLSSASGPRAWRWMLLVVAGLTLAMPMPIVLVGFAVGLSAFFRLTAFWIASLPIGIAALVAGCIVGR